MSRLPTLFVSHGSPMNAAARTASSDAWAALGARAASAARGADRVRALGNGGADADRQPEAAKRSTISADFPRSSIGSAIRRPARPTLATEAVGAA